MLRLPQLFDKFLLAFSGLFEFETSPIETRRLAGNQVKCHRYPTLSSRFGEIEYVFSFPTNLSPEQCITRIKESDLFLTQGLEVWFLQRKKHKYSVVDKQYPTVPFARIRFSERRIWVIFPRGMRRRIDALDRIVIQMESVLWRRLW